eukprot:COSAG06_NODE_3003_length_5970_cov_3.618123_2_plen_195_part_00
MVFVARFVSHSRRRVASPVKKLAKPAIRFESGTSTRTIDLYAVWMAARSGAEALTRSDTTRSSNAVPFLMCASNSGVNLIGFLGRLGSCDASTSEASTGAAILPAATRLLVTRTFVAGLPSHLARPRLADAMSVVESKSSPGPPGLTRKPESVRPMLSKASGTHSTEDCYLLRGGYASPSRSLEGSLGSFGSQE